MHRVLTIGHSNHAIQHFLGLLKGHGVEMVADARSHPRSRHARQYDAATLRSTLRHKGIGYAYYGRELGGRPEGREYYDTDGRVLYARVAESAAFTRGIERLVGEIPKAVTAILCSEEDPSVCHRRLLIARVLTGRGVAVAHIRGDGRLEDEEDLARGSGDAQLALFEEVRMAEWKSIPSVLPRRRLNDSSAS